MKDEFMDEDLIGMVNFTDETVPQQMPVMEQKAKPKAEYKTVETVAVTPKKQMDLNRKLCNAAKYLLICGGISMLLWWFEVNGLMAMEAAYPCILASAVIGGIGVGRSSK